MKFHIFLRNIHPLGKPKGTKLLGMKNERIETRDRAILNQLSRNAKDPMNARITNLIKTTMVFGPTEQRRFPLKLFDVSVPP